MLVFLQGIRGIGQFLQIDPDFRFGVEPSEKAFLAALGDYFRSYNGKIATPDDMKACFEAGKPGAATIIDNWLDDKVYAAGA